MPEPIVLDASAWLAVLLNEENAKSIENLIEERPLFAPELIRYETANGILFAIRKGRLKRSSLEDLLETIQDFPIQTISTKLWWHETTRLVQSYPLTFYDAAYIGTAIALDIPLVTLDHKILKVIAQEKLSTL